MSLTKHEQTAFSDAIEVGDVDKVAALIKLHPELVNHPDWTPPPLHCAVLWNQSCVAKLLIESGADIEGLDPDRKTTPLRYAIMYCKADLIPLLVQRGANAGPIVQDGTSALELAMEAEGGAYESYDDLPSRDEYTKVVDALKGCGVNR